MKTKEEILVEENMNLVGFIINTNYKNIKHIIHKLGLIEDFYQEGCIGLFTAAKSFDESKGFKFSTFGSKCIDCSLSKFLTRYIYKHYKRNNISIDQNKSIYEGTEFTILNEFPIYDKYGTDLHDIKEFIKQTDIKDIDKILDLSMNGLTQKEIGELIGIRQVEVSRRMKRLTFEYRIHASLSELARLNKLS